MRTRIISGLAGAVLLLAVTFLDNMAFSFLVSVISVIAIYEYYNSLSAAGFKMSRYPGYISCLFPFFAVLNMEYKLLDFNKVTNMMLLAAFFVIVFSFMQIIFRNGKYNIVDISLSVFGVFYVVFLFSFVSFTRTLEGGRYYIWLIFIGAFATDIAAYFSGKFLGRIKILPVISPKKTLEGSIGGAAGCILAILIYGITFQEHLKNMNLFHYIIIGLLCGILSQAGDWSASAIKRFAGIKDYGKIMPGHGGVLDRLDSILFTAPVVYFYIQLVVK